MSRSALLSLVLGSACVTPLTQLSHATRVTTAQGELLPGPIELRWSNHDAEALPMLTAAVAVALAPVGRWGAVERPVTLYVLKDHDDLERVIRRRGLPWLRAWARDDVVYLQSPRTWRAGGASPHDLVETLTHELTHVVTFQACGEADAWTKRDIPFWFREGLATVTAGQGYRYGSLEDAAHWVEANRDRDVFTEGDELAQSHNDAAYGLAHHAMIFLLRRYDDDAVKKTLAHLRAGSRFAQAFEQGVGLAPERFAHEFITYLLMRGFRGYGLPVHRPGEKLNLTPRDEPRAPTTPATP